MALPPLVVFCFFVFGRYPVVGIDKRFIAIFFCAKLATVHVMVHECGGCFTVSRQSE